MFKNLKLGTKIIGTVVPVLVLLAVVAYVGYSGLMDVEDRVVKSDDVNRMVKMVLEARQQEKNFIIRGDNAYVAKVKELVGEFIIQANETKDHFNQKINKDQMDQVINETTQYLQAFEKLVDMIHQNHATMEEMRAQARDTLAQIEVIRHDQKQQLEKILAETDDKAQVQDRVAKADDANRMIKWFLDTRKNEKEFIISNGQQKWLDHVDKDVARILSLSQDLKSRFGQAHNKEQVDKVIGSVTGYKQAFDKFAGLMKEQKAVDQTMVAAARAALKVCAEARADQKAKMEAQMSATNRNLVFWALAAFIIGTVLVIFTTRSIRPGVIGKSISGRRRVRAGCVIGRDFFFA